MTHPLLDILNTLWQAAAIAAAVWLVLRFARSTNAATRHAVWWMVLAVAALLPTIPSRRQDARPTAAPVAHAVFDDAIATPVGPRQPIAPTPRPRGVQLPSGDWPAIILSAWALAAFLQFARVAWSYRRLRLLKRNARPAGTDLRRSFDAWILACRVRRPVQLLVTDRVALPIAVGFRRPAVLLPESILADFTEPDLDHVLLHELAHIARRDDWTNLAARLAGGLFAFHPVALWLIRQIDRDRELACDDWVVSMTGAARPYATSLTRLFELCHTRNRLALATGMASRASHLGERVERLVRGRRNFFAKASVLKVGFACLALVAAGLAFSQTPRFLAIAQDVRPAPPVPPDAPHVDEVEEPAAPPDAGEPPSAPDAPEESDAPQGGFLAGLVAAGYGDLSVDEIIELKNSGVDGPYLAGMSKAGWGRISTREMVDLHNNGVEPDYARAVHAAGLRDASLKNVITLKQCGVDPESIARIHALGFGPFNASEAVELQNQGVHSDLFRAFQEHGWKNLSVREAVEARQSGLDGRALREARQFGSSLSLKQIIRLKQAGVI